MSISQTNMNLPNTANLAIEDASQRPTTSPSSRRHQAQSPTQALGFKVNPVSREEIEDFIEAEGQRRRPRAIPERIPPREVRGRLPPGQWMRWFREQEGRGLWPERRASPLVQRTGTTTRSSGCVSPPRWNPPNLAEHTETFRREQDRRQCIAQPEALEAEEAEDVMEIDELSNVPTGHEEFNLSVGTQTRLNNQLKAAMTETMSSKTSRRRRKLEDMPPVTPGNRIEWDWRLKRPAIPPRTSSRGKGVGRTSVP